MESALNRVTAQCEHCKLIIRKYSTTDINAFIKELELQGWEINADHILCSKCLKKKLEDYGISKSSG